MFTETIMIQLHGAYVILTIGVIQLLCLHLQICLLF